MKLPAVEVAVRTFACSLGLTVWITESPYGTRAQPPSIERSYNRQSGGWWSSPIPSTGILPQPNLNRMRNPDKRRDSRKEGRTAATNAPTTPMAARPRYYDDEFSSPTRPDYRPKPAPMPSIPGDVRHSTTTLPPYTGGEPSTYAYITPPGPPHESDTREAMIMWVLCSSAHPTSLAPQLTFLSTDSIMGATGSGKSTVCLFLVAF